MTRLLIDPATDFDDPAAVTISATLLDPGPALVRTFTDVTAATVVDLPAPDAAEAWRLTVRRPRTSVNRLGLTTVDPGPIVIERTVHFGGTTDVAWAALTDVDPATLRTTAVPGAAWDAAVEELRAEIDALPTGGGGSGVTVVDNGDGTITVSGDAVIDNGDGTFSIGTGGATVPSAGTLAGYATTASVTTAVATRAPIATATTATNALQRSLGALQGQPVVAGTNFRADATVRTSTGTHRVHYAATTAATDLRLVYTGVYQSTGTKFDTDPAATSTIGGAAIEVGGVIYPVTFNGQASTVLAPGGLIVSDPLPIDITPGADVAVRTFLSGAEWHVNRVAYTAGSGGFTTTANLTVTGSAAIPDATSFTNLYGPAAILGTSLPAAARSVVIVGDSIAFGLGDGPGDFQGYNVTNAQFGRGGYLGRALSTAGIGYVNLGYNGDRAAYAVTNPARFRRFALIGTARTAIVNYGVNDIYGAGRTLAQVQADLLTVWSQLANRGLRVIQTTITPSSTSTDGFLTTGGQAFNAGFNAVRAAVNDWLRAGAPIIAGAAVTTGTAGAVLAGAAAHPLTTVLEVADIVEPTRGAGIWKAPATARTVTDGAGTAAAFNVTSATAAFTSADLGRTILVTGAGTAGALLTTTITAITSATQVGLKDAVVTTVAGAALTVVDAVTQDGTHPQPYMAQTIASAIGSALATATV